MRKVLAETKAVDLSTALPGPLAASRLAEMGAPVTKIEPPRGDLLSQISPGWYSNINQGLAQSIPLQVEALGTVRLRYPRVADQHWRLQNDRFCDT